MENEEENYCCEWYARSTLVHDYDGDYVSWYCPKCQKQWTEDIYRDEDP